MQKELTKVCIAGLLTVGVGLLAACGSKGGKTSAVRPVPVRVQVVAAEVQPSFSRYVGTVQAVREIPLSMQTAGRVLSVHAKDGDYVQKGRVLLRVDSTQALNALRSAEAAYRQAMDGYERAKQVYAKGAITDQKMVEIESQYTQARSFYDAARQRLNENTLTAPQAGVVSGMNIQVGQSIAPAVYICSILDNSAYNIVFTVPETEISAIAIGQKGRMECAAVNASFPITLTEKSMKANPVAHTYEVTARIDTHAIDKLMPGMVAKCRLTDHRKADAQSREIVIPTSCILLMKEGPTVWVSENGKAVRRAITTDGYKADGVVVTDGLHAGDSLITDGYQKLYIGCEIAVEE